MKHATLAALSAAVWFLQPAAAHPQAVISQTFNGPLVVEDQTGAIIGQLLTEDLMARQYGRRIVSLSFSQQGLDNDFVFFYASANCSGQAYIETFYYRPVPDRALFDQNTLTIWEGDPNSQISLNANSATYGAGDCDPTVISTIDASPAIVIDATSRGFRPPFVVAR